MTLTEILTLQNYNVRIVVLATALLGVSSGLVGSLLLLRKRSLMGDVLSHATLPGIGIAFALSSALTGGKVFSFLLVGASLSGLLGISTLVLLRKTTRLHEDVSMGLVLSIFFGAGTAILAMVQTLPGSAGIESFIYGKTASIVQADLQLISTVTTLVVIAILLLRKEFLLLCFNESFAKTQGWPTLFLDFFLLLLVVAVTVVGLQAVGLILIIAFFIIPPAAARFWTNQHHKMTFLAAIIGACSGWLGSSLSALYANLPAGAIIVLSAASIFLFSFLFGSKNGVLPRYLASTKLRRRIGRQHLLRSIYELLENQSTSTAAISNQAVSLKDLQNHRSWSARELQRYLRQAYNEDHLASHPSDSVQLSESGFGEACRITRNHRLWEQYLITYADIAPSHVDRDADTVEHILDPQIVRELEKNLQAANAVPASPHKISPQTTSPT